jgi:hypothetical protein
LASARSREAEIGERQERNDAAGCDDEGRNHRRAIDLSRKRAAEAYSLAEAHEPNPRSVWGYAQGLTRLSQRTPWQDGRFTLDRAASRLFTTVQ